MVTLQPKRFPTSLRKPEESGSTSLKSHSKLHRALRVDTGTCDSASATADVFFIGLSFDAPYTCSYIFYLRYFNLMLLISKDHEL